MKKIILFLLLFIHTILLSNEQLKKVSIQFMWHDQYEFAGFYVAKEKGFYKKLGLDVEFKKFTIDTNITNEVVKGYATFGTGSSSLVIDKSNGKDIVLLGTIFQSSPLILLSLKRNDLKNIQDIKNKKIMLTADQQRFATLQSMLASKNVELSDIEIIPHSFNIDDLINNNTDLMLAYTTNEPYILKEKGYEGKIFHPKDYGFDFYEELIFTSSKFANENPKIVKDFYEATIKGWEYAFDNIDEVSKLVYNKYNPQKKSLESLVYEAQEMKKLVYTKDGKIGPISKERIKLIEYSYRVLGFLKNEFNIDDLIYSNKKDKIPLLTKAERQYLDINKLINMCIDPNWMPFEKNDKGKHVGISADYTKLMSEILQTPIKMVPTKTWGESLKLGKEKKCDIFPLLESTPIRRQYFNFTTTYLKMPLVLASKLDAPFIENINQLKSKKIGVVKEYGFAELLRIKYPDISFIDVENIEDGLKKVNDKKIDGFIDSLITVGYSIQNDYVGELKIAGKFEDSLHLSIGIRKDRPILLSIFNKVINQITDEQKQSIITKWTTINYQKRVDFTIFYIIISILVSLILIAGTIYRQHILNQANKELNAKVKEEIDKNNKQHEILIQHTKKVAMGEMLENIAHQWRQPLSVISVAASGIKLKKEFDELNDEFLMESVNSINESAQFLSKTIDDFRNFSIGTKVSHEFNMEDTIEKSLQLFGIKYNNYNIKIVKDIKSISIKSVESELIQVLINLLNNSKDAFEKSKDKKIIFINVKEEEKHLIIEIKDSAGGINSKVIKRIFDPYFTTKHQSQGTGIGLYMCEQIITKHMNGTINVKNESFLYNNNDYIGASFTISLPLSNS